MRILVVDDDLGLRKQLKTSLISQHYDVDSAADGEEALDKLFGSSYDLVVLDIMLPKRDGLAVLKEMRTADIDTPVIMLTARGSIDDRIKGLDTGADDYLPKPFAFEELVARIRSLLRRAGDQANAYLSVQGLTLNTINREIRFGSGLLTLTPKEFSIIEFLLYNKNRLITRFNLAEHVWGDAYDPFTMSNFIDVHIKNLRQKLKDAGCPEIVETVRGVGFIVRDESI
jgi:DNA-binding response OmpR family regulator